MTQIETIEACAKIADKFINDADDYVADTARTIAAEIRALVRKPPATDCPRGEPGMICPSCGHDCTDLVRKPPASDNAHIATWRPISSVPGRPMWVEFFMGNAPAELLVEPYRDERRYLGYWDGNDWRDSGTGHQTVERLEDGNYYFPTHWAPLPDVPKPPVCEHGLDPHLCGKCAIGLEVK